MVTPIDRTELLRLVAHEGMQVVDVLPDAEFAAAHLPGAVSIPLRRLSVETVGILRRDKPVAVY